jgi:hypothetical protein
MTEDRAPAPDGIQLRLVSLLSGGRRRCEEEIGDAAVRDLAAMVLFVLDNLSVEDRRRVLTAAYRRAGYP